MESHAVKASITSPTIVPLPASPNRTQSEFEALIDLLGTDEPAEQDPGGSPKKSEANDQPAHNLRDEGGRLDFVKISALFSSNDPNLRSSSALSSKTEKGSIDQTEHAPPKATAAIVLDSPAGTSRQSPMESSQLPADARDNLLEDLIDLSSEHPPWTSDHAEVSPLAIPSSSHVLLAQPLSQKAPTSLPDSLALAYQEVTGLRKRVRELEDLIKKSRGTVSPQWDHRSEIEDGETLSSFRENSPTKNSHQTLHTELPLQRDVDELESRRSRMMNEVSQVRDLNALSFSQTRIVLKSLLDDLALPFSCVPSLLKKDRTPRTVPTSSLEEIHRAIDMVTFVDELVWRRSRMGAIYDNPYSKENVQALRDRLELWEKTVRTRR